MVYLQIISNTHMRVKSLLHKRNQAIHVSFLFGCLFNIFVMVKFKLLSFRVYHGFTLIVCIRAYFQNLITGFLNVRSCTHLTV